MGSKAGAVRRRHWHVVFMGSKAGAVRRRHWHVPFMGSDIRPPATNRRGALLDRQGSLHARLLVRVHIAEERVLPGLQVLEREGRRGVGHLIRATERGATLAVDAHIV